MSAPDCPECGEHVLSCTCNKKKKRKKPIKGSIIVEPSFEELYGHLRDIPNETLYKFLEENETKDAAFLAIVCSEILRRGVK